MNSVAIFMEGGGQGREFRTPLRAGMDVFLRELKETARAKSWRWNLSCSGSRNAAFKDFEIARRRGGHTLVVLLVDAEGPVSASPRDHLSAKEGWNMGDSNDDAIHLMTQTMETWILADSEALADYYGQNFAQNALPKSDDLEKVSKEDVEQALKQATRKTQKGAYHKIEHASDLLELIDPKKAREKCRHCDRLFSVLNRVMAGV